MCQPCVTNKFDPRASRAKLCKLCQESARRTRNGNKEAVHLARERWARDPYKSHFGREVQKFHGWFYLLTGGSLIARYCTIPLSPAPSNPLTDGLQIELQDGAEYVQMSKAETRADLRAARNSYPCKRGGDAQEDRLAQPGMLEGLTVIRCNFLLRIKLAVHTWRQAWQSCETQTRNHSIAIASCWPPVQTAQRPRESLCCRLHATKPGMVTQCELKTWKSVSVCGTLNGRKWYKVIKWKDISE